MLSGVGMYGQETDAIHYPDGIYRTVDDFLNRQADTLTQIRKVNLDVDLSKAFLDTLVDRCFFIDKKRDPLRKCFAIVFDGEIYFQEYGISAYQAYGYRREAKNEKYFCYRVLERGKYLYCIAKSYEQGYYGGGLVGVALADLGPAVILDTALLFDTTRKRFFSFNRCALFETFLQMHHPGFEFDCGKARQSIDSIRQAVRELNGE
jgi:hypothetical protein